MLGLFGALAAGLAVDAFSSSRSDEDRDNGLDEGDSLIEAEGTPEGFIDIVDSEEISTKSGDADRGLDEDTVEGLDRGFDDGVDVVPVTEGEASSSDDLSAGGIVGTVDSPSVEQTDNVVSTDEVAIDFLKDSEACEVQEGSAESDTLLGDQGKDLINAGPGDDWLNGDAGNDKLAGQSGSDLIDGGSGDDWLSGLDNGVDDHETDYLSGGAGQDKIILGSGDYALGGADGDEFFVAGSDQNGPATVADYDSTSDRLFVVYDPAVNPAPSLCVQIDEDETYSTISLDGTVLAVVYGAPVTAADIKLVSLV